MTAQPPPEHVARPPSPATAADVRGGDYQLNPTYPPPQVYYYPAPTPGPSGIGIAGFVSGLVGLILFWLGPVGLCLAVLGVVLSAVAISQARTTRANTGLAIAGLVLGIVAVIPCLIFVLDQTNLR
ncbi:MAG: DUF4190 domain-containing protein [Actinobacteria bacterium]|nr:DUF4190 domain-containing protein [Actinomycetota bacterium]